MGWSHYQSTQKDERQPRGKMCLSHKTAYAEKTRFLLWDHCLVKLTLTCCGCKARATLFYVMHLLYHYHQLFIEIEREKTSCIFQACFICRVTCYNYPDLMVTAVDFKEANMLVKSARTKVFSSFSMLQLYCVFLQNIYL